MNKQKLKQSARIRRKARTQVRGTAERPRLSVFRSLKNISAQLIDDAVGKTVVAVLIKDIKVDKKMTKTETANEIGKILAEKAKSKGIKKIVFDKGAYKYHGRIKALADGAREGGLEF
ncbi:50S ribosomal protein L18 [Patescibacteria group bacterium]|nr:50S ribosomal protein L18 [Patescibacteria group bacterium]